MVDPNICPHGKRISEDCLDCDLDAYGRDMSRAQEAMRNRKLTTDDFTQAARNAYRDAGCPERTCDNCGKTYRGPAVFCSLECALAAA